ncbi:hypothetical protein QZH41_007988 [Actinostola sp. cb2023]|nr:hypothetical protein QZH41_007988 [Actinostola sp. cb2023]
MPVSSHFVILYGSETGQAQAIAEEIHENSTQHGLQSKLFCLSQTEKKFSLENEPLVVFVVSTTGDGEPPDTMCKFMRRLRKKTLPTDHLKDCQYALLALGDTNYTNFCNNGKTLDRRLLGLGAKQFYNTGYADDAVGLELVVDPWINGLWSGVKTYLGLDNKESISNGIASDILESNNSNTNEEPCTVEKLKQTPDDEIEVKKDSEPDESSGLKSVGTIDETKNTKDQTIKSMDTTETSSTSTCSSNPGHATLRASSEPLCSSALSIPLLSSQYLTVEYDATASASHDKEDTCFHHNQSFSMATILSAKTLTSKDAVKTALEVELDITGCGLDYEPGDSFDVLCSNSELEVAELINILGLQTKAEMPFSVQVAEGTTKKVAVRPSYIPDPCTIKAALLHCLEIRTVPKKAMLRMFVEYTDNPQEKRRLQELCSKQGTKDYQTFIRQPSASLLELMKAFPSCCPPFERLLEHIPQLTPRPYSVASSPLRDLNKLKFVFNIIEFPPYEGLRSERTGVCTGCLSRATISMRDEGSLVDGMTRLQLDEQPSTQSIKVPVTARKKNQFKLPKDAKTPIIMIGPGTGVAPFLGFLEHRKLECEDRDPKEAFGPTWLFFGCRNSNQDFLYKDELKSYESSGVLTNLLVAFSREEMLYHPICTG